eukprot:TRINITY_DN1063_c1_g1_i4.p1 TRINITY_DN1063_c1_g1~~TRINITY_DN1063_c1_g1_i4.p1  ORF type:complete len:405 (-),score=71.39 TRINITY_DN1063_c1_g1_i4:1160-2374(-)
MCKVASIFILFSLLIHGKVTAQQTGARAVNQFSQKLQPFFCQEGKNCAFSAYSIFSALGLTFAGAQGNTQTQIQDVLNLGGLDTQQVHQIFLELISSVSATSQAIELSQANRFYGANEAPFLSTYLDTIKNFYQTEAANINFNGDPEGSRQQINGVVNEITRGLISDILPPGSVTSDTISVLVNAIYFKGAWFRTFDMKDTSPRQFTSTSGAQFDVPMMAQFDEMFRLGDIQSLGASFINLPYQGFDASMYIVVPKSLSGQPANSNIYSIAQSIDFDELFFSESEAYTNLFLPKFTVEFEALFSSALKSLGMVDAFDGVNSNFEGMIDRSVDIVVTEGYHKAKVIVDEAGTEAAAGTAFGFEAVSMTIMDSIEFLVDVPFAFFIVKEPQNVVLFSGIIDNPIQG